MALTETSKQKAATLLMSVDTTTACELLKGLAVEEIQELTVTMAQMETSSGRDKKTQAKIVREFYNSLKKSKSESFSIKSFLSKTLVDLARI